MADRGDGPGRDGRDRALRMRQEGGRAGGRRAGHRARRSGRCHAAGAGQRVASRQRAGGQAIRRLVKAIMTRIIERKYLVQQAIASKIDREPTVHLDLLRSRENILAGAYAQRDVSQKATGISKSEIDGYIQGHPDKFAQSSSLQHRAGFLPARQGHGQDRRRDQGLQDHRSGRGQAERVRGQVQPRSRRARQRDHARADAQDDRRRGSRTTSSSSARETTRASSR